jgi:hypothetical protein
MGFINLFNKLFLVNYNFFSYFFYIILYLYNNLKPYFNYLIIYIDIILINYPLSKNINF